MSYSYKCYSDTKGIMKKYVNAVEGAAIYGLGKTRIMTLAKEEGAVYKVGKSQSVSRTDTARSGTGTTNEKRYSKPVNG